VLDKVRRTIEVPVSRETHFEVGQADNRSTEIGAQVFVTPDQRPLPLVNWKTWSVQYFFPPLKVYSVKGGSSYIWINTVICSMILFLYFLGYRVPWSGGSTNWRISQHCGLSVPAAAL
jgi:uncharacterized membrane protein YqaE (UPF0057 family)